MRQPDIDDHLARQDGVICRAVPPARGLVRGVGPPSGRSRHRCGERAHRTGSALERRYLRDVERAHGLPEGRRQARAASGARSEYRDVHYEEEETFVELDGRLGHDGTEDRWDDLDRDVASAVEGKLTVRVGWRQVLGACRLAKAVGAILQARQPQTR